MNWRNKNLVVDSQQKEIFNEITQKIFLKKKISRLTEIQKKAIPYISSNENLVVVAPSGAGKTLIAELISIMDFISNKQLVTSIDKLSIISNQNSDKKSKTIFLVPLRALADEKARTFATNYREYKLRIHLSMSEVDFNEEKINKCDILISTYERFRTILGRLPELIHSIKNVVIDEFHLIGDKTRGPVLETILTSLRENVRLILLSATIDNPEDIANWLEAKLICSDKRFIPLDYSIISTLNPELEIRKAIKRSIAINSQMLIFSGTRSKAEENAQDFADYIHKQCKELVDFKPDDIKSFLEKYSIPQDTVGNRLVYELVQKGTAFHHAGLSSLTKKLIEELFRRRWIKVLFCTETLGAGINLPAREVMILDTKRWNNEWLSRNVFHQIAGRAGRPNFDNYGFCSILSVDSREKRTINERYWEEASENINSISMMNLKPKYDKIISKIQSLDEFERMILTLIYSKKPTKEELLKLLMDSYHNYMNWSNNEEKKWIDSRLFYEMIVDFESSNISELFALLEKQYQTAELNVNEIFEDEEKQIIEIFDGRRNSFVTLKDNTINCSCNSKDIFCSHQLFVTQQMNKNHACLILENNFSILKKLIKNEYIYEKSSGNYFTTIKGSIWAEMGITRNQFEFLREWLIYDLIKKGKNLGKMINECLLVMTKINAQDSYLNYLEFKRPLYDYILLKQEFSDVVKRYHLYEGDFFRILMNLKSLITGLIPLADFLGLMNIKQIIETLDILITDTIFKR
ncbi:MAG: DEAD/DEAH box helicase [Asgard group archaeon]|nr:DEAD/DEAH box helicase [Asgard group archaeon]